MKRAHLAAAGVLVAAGAASAQLPSIVVTHTLQELDATTGLPVAPNGLVEPGESIRISLNVQLVGIGMVVYVETTPTTVIGLGSLFVDMLAPNANGGTWTFERAPGWSLGSGGTASQNGAVAMQAGQFPLPGTIANGAGFIEGIISATWTPASFSPRVVNFNLASAAGASGIPFTAISQYGTSPEGWPQYTSVIGPTAFTNLPRTIPISIVPAPNAAAVVLGAGLVIAMQRRTRSKPEEAR